MNQAEALESLRSEDRNTVVNAALYLSSCKNLTRTLLKMLPTERRAENRQGILYALAWQGDRRAWWPFLKIVADVSDDPVVRGQAAEGIEYLWSEKRPESLGFRAALAVLREALTDPSPEVRNCVVIALGSSRRYEVLPWLLALTGDTTKHESVVGSIGRQAWAEIDDIVR